MARKPAKVLTDLELDIMRLLWQREEATVEDLATAFAQRGRILAEPSFRTMLSILRKKGYATRRRAGRGFLYRATVPSAEVEKNILRDLIDRVFDGSAAGLVAALVQQGIVGEKHLAKARKLIAKREKGEE
ncbi:MAG: BlaI/MecI/CopY family transcriptional regulator [Candidatus Hydrogenedentes bacterium]|nr:BlaI/MecI/CopY family transcriptional regulator [Candidatus Hydrogenedentota bacterium]